MQLCSDQNVKVKSQTTSYFYRFVDNFMESKQIACVLV